jgi:Protein of unknown function (DUF2009)
MNSEVQSALGFNLHAPLKTIHVYLSSLNPPMLHMLDDEFIEPATREIRPEGKTRKMYIPPNPPLSVSPFADVPHCRCSHLSVLGWC